MKSDTKPLLAGVQYQLICYIYNPFQTRTEEGFFLLESFKNEAATAADALDSARVI
jgi:hypothetical protein